MTDQDELLRRRHMTYPEWLQPDCDREPTGHVILYIIAAVLIVTGGSLIALGVWLL